MKLRVVSGHFAGWTSKGYITVVFIMKAANGPTIRTSIPLHKLYIERTKKNDTGLQEPSERSFKLADQKTHVPTCMMSTVTFKYLLSS